MLSCMVNGFEHDDACDHEMPIFREPEGNPGIFFSKQPSDIKRVHMVLPHDPNLFVICMERDPRSVISSIHPIDPERYFSDFKIWKESHEATLNLRDEPRFCVIRYENLVRDPDGVQRDLSNRCSFLKITGLFSEFDKKAKPASKAEEAMKGVRPISTDRIDGWKEHLPRIKAQLEKYPELTTYLKAFGYENNDDWLEILDGVEADRSASYFEDEISWLRSLEQVIRYRLRVGAYKRRRAKAGE